MYKTSEEVFDKLVSKEIKMSSLTRNMNKNIHKGNLEQWLLLAKAKGMYKIWELGN